MITKHAYLRKKKTKYGKIRITNRIQTYLKKYYYRRIGHCFIGCGFKSFSIDPAVVVDLRTGIDC